MLNEVYDIDILVSVAGQSKLFFISKGANTRTFD